MGPVNRGHLKFESLIDGTVDLAHVALLNDMIAASDENAFRAQEAARKAAQRG